MSTTILCITYRICNFFVGRYYLGTNINDNNVFFLSVTGCIVVLINVKKMQQKLVLSNNKGVLYEIVKKKMIEYRYVCS